MPCSRCLRPDATPDRLAMSGQVSERVTEAMNELSASERTAFVLRHFEGMCIDVSRLLGCQPGAAKHSVFRARTGDTAVTNVLDELERVLLDITHSPSEISPEELRKLRSRLEAEGILFKIRVLGSNVRNQDKPADASAARPEIVKSEILKVKKVKTT